MKMAHRSEFEFHKMHGAGNDFVLMDLRHRKHSLDRRSARKIADRRLGVGCDQILVLHDALDEDCLARYEIWNRDGSPAGQCGNGARCIGLYLLLSGEAGSKSVLLESPSGRVSVRAIADGQFEVGMGVPEFEPQKIPVDLEARAGLYSLPSDHGPIEFGAVSMGNPHALVLVEDIRTAPVERVGGYLGSHTAFPEGCNVGFAQRVDAGAIHLRVFERGAGETRACGSGACAAMAILRQRGQASERMDVFLPGGHLVIKWPGTGSQLMMQGPAVHVFRGTMNE
jgi:diaminopimelate epimerase